MDERHSFTPPREDQDERGRSTEAPSVWTAAACLQHGDVVIDWPGGTTRERAAAEKVPPEAPSIFSWSVRTKEEACRDADAAFRRPSERTRGR